VHRQNYYILQSKKIPVKCEIEALVSVKQEDWEHHSDLDDLENQSNRDGIGFNSAKYEVMN